MQNLILTTLLAVALAACGQIGSGNKTADAVTDPTPRQGWSLLKTAAYQVAYPEGWQLDQSGVAGTTFILFGRSAAEGKFRENINLLIQDLRGYNMNMDQYVKISEEQIATMLTNGSLLESKRLNDNNDERHLVIYAGEQGGHNLKWKQFYRISAEKAYVLSFTGTQDTYDDLIKMADEIMDSFHLVD